MWIAAGWEMRQSGEVVRLAGSGAPFGVWRVLQRPLPPGRLAVVATGQTTTVVVLADDVPATDTAAVLRHLRERHHAAGVSACMAPYCDAVEEWRPSPAVPLTDAVTA